MNETLTILGSSSAIPTPHRNPSSHALLVDDRIYLIDCAEGTQVQMQRFGVKMLKIHAVFISHLHGDHFFGLPGLISTMHLQGRNTPLHIHGPEGLEEMMKLILSYARHELAYEVFYHTVDTGQHKMIFHDEKVEVYSIPLEHRLPTSGYLFRRPQQPLNIRREFILEHDVPIEWFPRLKAGEDFLTPEGDVIPNNMITKPPSQPWSYAYCSDTKYTETIIPYIKGVNLLYHEASYGDEKADMASDHMHSTARQAATIAKLAEVKQLLIGHFSNRYKDFSPLLEQAREVFPATEAVEDGMIWKNGVRS
jgi:ribonuclease Z